MSIYDSGEQRLYMIIILNFLSGKSLISVLLRSFSGVLAYSFILNIFYFSSSSVC